MLDHGRTLVDLPDEYLADIGPVLKKVAHATGAEQYNILQVSRIAISSTPLDDRQPHFLLYQNNGKLAFQVDIIFPFHGDFL